MKFLIQRIDGEVVHDFSFKLLEAFKYWTWWYTLDINIIEYKFYDGGEIEPDYIPVGSVEFVSNYLETYYGKRPKPINIPLQLLDEKYTLRKVFNGTEKDIVGEKFVKSNDKIKSFTEITTTAPVGNYQISDVIDEIDSEWRAFVYNKNVYDKKLVGLQNYSGDFTLFPDVDKIHEMIKVYTDSPTSYTLDIGVNKNGTFVIEVHDIFSCGLYGFSSKKLPHMYRDWFNEFIKTTWS